MGLFSWNCNGCGKSIRHNGACTALSAWMSRAVWLFEDNQYLNIMSGEYTGYGKIQSQNGTLELHCNNEEAPCLYHWDCWIALGRPKEIKPSIPAADQGHFVGDFDPEKPTTPEEVASIRKKMTDDWGANANWDNDAIQFPRLIEEAQALGVWTPSVIAQLATEMDLTNENVQEILDRAGKEWGRIKAQT